MANKTDIEWTDFNWNFLRGCSRVSEGCRNCYAESVAARFSGVDPNGKELPYFGLAQMVNGKPRWTGEIKFIPAILEKPLHWTRPRKIFVNSMSDLFHEKVADEVLDQAFAVMTLAPQHTYQILTKRPERMRDYMRKISDPGYFGPTLSEYEWLWSKGRGFGVTARWPAQNKSIWLGVSAEDQKTADERIPLLLDTPAAVRWVSAEPLLGPVDLEAVKVGCAHNSLYCACSAPCEHSKLDWVVVGGESGPGARPCDITWLRSIVHQCKAASVPVFVKQLGAGKRENMLTRLQPVSSPGMQAGYVSYRDSKGGDMTEWPEDLRVREYPGGAE